MLDHFSIHIVIEFVIVADVAIQASYHSSKGKIFLNAHVASCQLFNFCTGICQAVFGVENGWFVHVVPETVNPLFRQNSIFLAKPISCFWLQEIWEMYPTRPDSTDKVATLGILTEIIVLYAFFIDIIAVFDFYASVNNRNKVNALFFHVCGKFFQIREAFGINGKIFVPFHIINIQINAVQWNASILILFCDCANIFFGLIAPAALTISECPERRNIASANHFPELLDDVLFAFACDDINRQVIGSSMNLHYAPLGIADVKLHLSSEVEECTEGHCTMNDDEVVCTIKRTSIFMVVGVVIVPADILPASLVDATNLFAQTIDNVVFRKRVSECPLLVCFKKRQCIGGRLNVQNNCIGREWGSVNIFFNHNSTSFQKVHCNLFFCMI